MTVEQDAAVGQVAVGQDMVGGQDAAVGQAAVHQDAAVEQDASMVKQVLPPKQSRRGLRSQIRLGEEIP